MGTSATLANGKLYRSRPYLVYPRKVLERRALPTLFQRLVVRPQEFRLHVWRARPNQLSLIVFGML